MWVQEISHKLHGNTKERNTNLCGYLKQLVPPNHHFMAWDFCCSGDSDMERSPSGRKRPSARRPDRNLAHCRQPPGVSTKRCPLTNGGIRGGRGGGPCHIQMSLVMVLCDIFCRLVISLVFEVAVGDVPARAGNTCICVFFVLCEFHLGPMVVIYHISLKICRLIFHRVGYFWALMRRIEFSLAAMGVADLVTIRPRSLIRWTNCWGCLIFVLSHSTYPVKLIWKHLEA